MTPRVTAIFYALHVFGVISWIGGLMSLIMLLYAGEKEGGETRTRIAALAKMRAMGTDIGATVAMATGIFILIKLELYKQPYMHIKLTLVLVILAIHGIIRASIKKAASGGKALPKWITPVAMLTGLAILMLVFLKEPHKNSAPAPKAKPPVAAPASAPAPAPTPPG